MPASVLESAELAIRVSAQPDSVLDASGGLQDVSAIEIVDLRTDRKLGFGNVRQTGLVPTDVLARNCVLFADPDGQSWMWYAGRTLRLASIPSPERLRARYQPVAVPPPPPGEVHVTLSEVSYDCPTCGGIEKFTGRVRRNDAGPWTALVVCFRCEEEVSRSTARTAEIIDAYAASLGALPDQPTFLHALATMRNGPAADRRALLSAGRTNLPLLSASEAGCTGELLPLWADRMLHDPGWLPRPSMLCRLEEVLSAAVNANDTGCADRVLAMAGRCSPGEMTLAISATARRCGNLAVYGADSVIARVVAS